MNKTLRFAIGVPVVVVFFLSSLTGCKKKEEEPAPAPIPAAAPAPTPTPAPVVIEVDSGPAVPDAAPVAKSTGKASTAAADPTGLRACCAALEQNAASMPAPNNAYALQAAAICKSLAAAGAGKGGAAAQITAAMKGANIPPACK
jgi:hypothetical protein